MRCSTIPDIDLVGFSVDAPGRGGGDVSYACVMAQACVDAKTDKRLVFFNNTVRFRRQRGGAHDHSIGANIAYLSGMRPALAAIRQANALQLKPPPATEHSHPRAAAQPLPADEAACFRLLSEAGVPMVRRREGRQPRRRGRAPRGISAFRS